MPSRFIFLILLVLGSAIADGVPAASPNQLTPGVEERLRADLADAKLDSFTLFEGALIAGGVRSEDQLATHKLRFAQLCQSVAIDVREANHLQLQADRLVVQLHDHVLTGEYRAECSALGQTMESGDFNCVTATILFQCLAQQVGLPVQAVAARGHVLCAVETTPRLFIEPTCRQWRTCEVADCPEPTAKFVHEARGLSAEQLLGKVYYNLGVARLQRREFEAAAEWLHIAERLDPQDQAARANWLATFNNWALALCDREQFAEAAKLVRRGLETDSHYAPLLTNDLHIHQKWIKRLCDDRQFAEAVTILDDGIRRRPEAEWFARGRRAVLELQRQAVAQKADPSQHNSEWSRENICSPSVSDVDTR